MEDKYYKDDFEAFLDEQVKNHRMYPSDHIWRNIAKELHGEKRWPALTIAAFALFIATVAVCVYFTPKPNIFSLQQVTVAQHQSLSSATPVANLSSGSFLRTEDKLPFTGINSVQKEPSPHSILSEPSALYVPVDNEVLLKVADEQKLLPKPTNLALALTQDEAIKLQQHYGQFFENQHQASSIDFGPAIKSGTELTAASEQQIIPEVSNSDTVIQPVQMAKALASNDDIATPDHKITLPRKNRLSYTIYFAPSLSYRLLNEQSFSKTGNTQGPVAMAQVTDVNEVVRHKPGVGLEMGVNFLYNINPKLSLTAGLQFNVRQYTIQAYATNIELATIALYNGNTIDSLTTFTHYRTGGGYSNIDLLNRYYQVSIPVGLEWQILGNRKIQLNVAGSLQPTYQLNKNAYLLTSDLQKYTENSSVFRNWNMNSNVEAFVSFKVGDFKWKVGPQLRYQHLSTFLQSYTLREHLLDYGLKLGFTKSIH